jgi:hypothetical protein
MPPRKTNYHKSNFYNRTTRTPRRNATNTTWLCNSPYYRGIRTECQWRMGSYRNVYTQFTGTGRNTVVSPTTANKWMRYVNNGVQVYKFNFRDFTRYFGARWTNATPTAFRKYLNQRYGATIKDVTRGKGNCWLIAASRTPTARPFNNYNWM